MSDQHEWVKFPVSGLVRCRRCRILKSVWHLRVSGATVNAPVNCDELYQDGINASGRIDD